MSSSRSFKLPLTSWEWSKWEVYMIDLCVHSQSWESNVLSQHSLTICSVYPINVQEDTAPNFCHCLAPWDSCTLQSCHLLSLIRPCPTRQFDTNFSHKNLGENYNKSPQRVSCANKWATLILVCATPCIHAYAPKWMNWFPNYLVCSVFLSNDLGL